MCLVLVPLLCAANDWNYEETRNDARDFVAGGFVHVRLNVGDMHVKRGDTNKIRMRYTVKSRREKNVKEANVDFDVRGNNATIEFHSPRAPTRSSMSNSKSRRTPISTCTQKSGTLRWRILRATRT